MDKKVKPRVFEYEDDSVEETKQKSARRKKTIISDDDSDSQEVKVVKKVDGRTKEGKRLLALERLRSGQRSDSESLKMQPK